MKRERSTSTVLTGHHSTVWCVSVDWDNQLALSESGDCTLHLWDIQQRSTVRVLRGHKSIVWCLAVNWEPQNRMAVSGADDHTIRLWDLDRGECLHVFKGHKCAVQCLSVDWARMRVLSGSEDKTLRVWYLDRKAFLQELNPAQGGSPGSRSNSDACARGGVDRTSSCSVCSACAVVDPPARHWELRGAIGSASVQQL